MSGQTNLLQSLREDARFDQLRALAETNWREQAPKLVARLEKQGELQERLDSAAETAVLILHQCEERGLSPDQARELAYEDILLSDAGE